MVDLLQKVIGLHKGRQMPPGFRLPRYSTGQKSVQHGTKIGTAKLQTRSRFPPVKEGPENSPYHNHFFKVGT